MKAPSQAQAERKDEATSLPAGGSCAEAEVELGTLGVARKRLAQFAQARMRMQLQVFDLV